MSPQLHYYNPGHEAFVLSGTPFYTPSANVCKLVKDLALLPAWYAAPGDYVFVEEIVSPRFFSTLPKELRPPVTLLTKETIGKNAASLPVMDAAPWGISHQSIHLYNELKEKYGLDIHVPDWKEEYFGLMGRQTGAACFDKIKTLLPDMELPLTPLFFSTLPEIEDYLALQTGAFICKTPYSSSGRGLLWLDNGRLNDKDRSWLKGALSKQGSVSIEPALNKWNDFALEFYSDGEGSITYEGISLFDTNKRGAYQGNTIEHQSGARLFLEEAIGADKFRKVKEAVSTVLQQTYGTLYKGYLGVDMLMYRTPDKKIDIHPCIEINMRYTMGMAAIKIFEQYIHGSSNGVFNITYESNPKNTNAQHQFMKKAYPLTIVDGKLKEGYLSLCPITKDTHYRAFIVVH